jgi:hypothetical protein
MTGNFITSRLGDVMNAKQTKILAEKQRKILDEIRFEAHIGKQAGADSDERKKILRYIEKLATLGLS